MNELTEFGEAWELVEKFFDSNEHKTAIWFDTPNPLLGNVKPHDMVSPEGNCPKLLKWIKTQLIENSSAGGRVD